MNFACRGHCGFWGTMNNVLSIDTGSTRTSIAVVDIDTLSCVNRIDFYNTEFDSRFVPAIKNIISTSTGIRKANITSCVKALAVKAKELCAGTNLLDEINAVRAHEKLPVSINYDEPETLGTDRICDALACAALFGGRSCIIIDAGTAITVDYLRGGRALECGMILPGLLMQFEALHGKTDALPIVNTDKEAALSLPSTSTEMCIRAGVLYGTAGAVASCVSEILRINGGNNTDTLIIATGGGWEAIKPIIRREITTIPDLTLIGAAVYSSPDLGK